MDNGEVDSSVELAKFLANKRKLEAEEKLKLAEKKKREKELKERRKNLRAVRKTNKLMQLGETITKLIDQLEDYADAVTKGTATKKQVGQLYFTMNDLAMQNRKIKGSFKDA